MHGEHVVYRDSLKPKLCPRFILGGSGITVKWLGWQGNWRVLISCKNHEHQLCWHGTESREKTWMSLKWWACPTLSNMFMSFFNVLNHTKIETFAGKKWLHVACDNKDIEWADDVAETRNEKIKATEKVNLVLIFLSCACATSEFQFHCSNLPQLCALAAFNISNKGCHCNCGLHQKQFEFHWPHSMCPDFADLDQRGWIAALGFNSLSLYFGSLNMAKWQHCMQHRCVRSPEGRSTSPRWVALTWLSGAEGRSASPLCCEGPGFESWHIVLIRGRHSRMCVTLHHCAISLACALVRNAE